MKLADEIGCPLLPGNPSCQGCPHAIGLKALSVLKNPIVVVPAGCTTIIAGIHPKSSIDFPLIHVPFASAPAVACGLSKAYDNVVVWMGDGAADIGFATLSGSAIRNDNIIVIVSDNEAYMNTGIQASGTTFWKAKTTTSPTGKREEKKDLALIMLMHRVPYVATASIGYMRDFVQKVKKAGSTKGFRFIHLHSPCPPGWRFDSSKTVEIARMAVKSGAWILWEYDGKFRLTGASRKYREKDKRFPLADYIKAQGRFRGLSDDDVREIEIKIDNVWKVVEVLERTF
ncbi:thiamine pyrophosphate-dependent enzyme [Archaeoglobus profundus]|uniref:Thiamine pyrophosphate protein domain protein TPP-binding protein n=1 Tax=Archaeoglobus profundus (strain DSM 5631 / JCM 9629 / NBRC 100127 / Av18) TaxID=572546 RepID=D2RHQ2_ARCPA|nr:thiamine pyrophosphate-dependent enzyme [Archaeoglobus profundus]ADB57827.1 thiamine pyrophosphate protein domain protein TPP-binding protein [Archaeoglobus profundus DSM 5631]